MLDLLLCAAFFGLPVALIVVYNVRAYRRVYGSLPTYDGYKRRHPDRLRFGRCHCANCGSGRIYVHSLDAIHRRHICATCGTVLYRS
jgi:hypothetical protein